MWAPKVLRSLGNRPETSHYRYSILDTGEGVEEGLNRRLLLFLLSFPMSPLYSIVIIS